MSTSPELVTAKSSSLDPIAQPNVIDDTPTFVPESEQNDDPHIDVSTPFAVNSTKFEYPFPTTEVDSDVSSNPSHANWPALPSNRADSSSGSSDTFSSAPAQAHSRSFLAFPTFKIILPLLPTPPAILKRRPKWDFGLLGKRPADQAPLEVQSSVDQENSSSTKESLEGIEKEK